MNKYKHIFFDFNGTILNDVDLCLELLNIILRKHNKKELNIEEYKNVFGFPIEEYYKKAGVDFNIDSYESLSKWFIKIYMERCLKCSLYDGLTEILLYLRNKNYKLYILSASERNNLYSQCKHFGIVKYFDDILGIDNIFAASKTKVIDTFMRDNNINGSDCLFIGDSIHDKEVADSVLGDTIFVSFGHQSKNRLSACNTKIIDSFSELKEML